MRYTRCRHHNTSIIADEKKHETITDQYSQTIYVNVNYVEVQNTNYWNDTTA